MVHLAPEESMQFSHTINQLLYLLWHANQQFGPPWLAKINLADDFYHLGLSRVTMVQLGIILPSYKDEEPLIAFCTTLPLG